MADPDEIDAAMAAGVRGVTHLFNAMGPINARVPGPAGATLANSELIAGLIVDGLHVDPVMVRLAWQALGPDRIALVTDAIAALGLPTASTRSARHTSSSTIAAHAPPKTCLLAACCASTKRCAT